MAGLTYKLTMADGSTREVVRRPIHQVRAEAVSGVTGTSGSLSYVYAMLWAADTGGTGSRRDFERWLETVDDFEHVPDEGDDADPPVKGETPSPT